MTLQKNLYSFSMYIDAMSLTYYDSQIFGYGNYKNFLNLCKQVVLILPYNIVSTVLFKGIQFWLKLVV